MPSLTRTHVLFKGLCLVFLLSLPGCKYYGSALPPEYPLSMDDAATVASDQAAAAGGTRRPISRKITRPRVERPSYLPEKELAIVAPPQTLLVWTYPHVTDDNTRVFGNWSTIFLTDRYQWVRPNNELGDGQDDAGVPAGRPSISSADPGAGLTQEGDLDGTTATSIPARKPQENP